MKRKDVGTDTPAFGAQKRRLRGVESCCLGGRSVVGMGGMDDDCLLLMVTWCHLTLKICSL